MKLVYTSRTGNVEKLVNEINTSNTLKIETGKEVLDEAAVLVTYTDGAGILPETVRSFLDANKGKVRLAAVSGNHVKHPTTFTGAADILEKEYGIPVIARFDLAGSEAVVKAVKAALHLRKSSQPTCSCTTGTSPASSSSPCIRSWRISMMPCGMTLTRQPSSSSH